MLNEPVRVKDLGAFILVWIIFHAVFSIADELTITTYYPSPYGVYDQLRTRNDTFLAVNGPAQTAVGLGAVLAGGAKLAVNGQVRGGTTVGGQQAPVILDGVLQGGLPAALINNPLSGAGSGGIVLGQALSRQVVTIYGSLRIIGPACGAAVPLPTEALPGVPTPLVCAGGYVTWTPGLFIEGESHQPNSFIYLGASEYPAFDLTADPNGPVEPPGVATYKFKAGSGYYFCCPLP